ncbi:MAG TPA: TetR/AcrR family transcriptional regulator [Bryobacteraceae bacterium]|jgi:AcrR family transcriptional regulator
MMDTKQKILETAERLFGEQGYNATSLRQIITEASVNLAAIHYHFGSKEELLDEMIQRKAKPVNEKRLAMLDRIEAEAGDGPLAVEKVLESFMLPMSEAADRNPEFVRLMGRMYAEGMMPAVLQRHFHQVIARFLGAMRKALPGLPENELLWRIHFMTGAMAHTMCGPPDFALTLTEPLDFRGRVKRLVAFLCRGFYAPVPQYEKTEVNQ